MVDIYYRNTLIAQEVPNEETEELISLFTNERRLFYNQLYDRIEKFLENLCDIRLKEKFETNKEYLKFIEKNYKDNLLELELIGKEFYRQNYKGFYFYNAEDGYIGFNIKNKDTIENIPLSVVLLKCCKEIPKKKDFTIKERVVL